MRLSRLEIYGFKSFAQRTEIVFNHGITGIVGPNGSGKSNIGDAVRWVLGEQSARMLRGSKMEDVIFGGTEKRKALSYCEVSLVFDNEDRALSMDCAEVMVTRRVYRSGESEYYLNKQACRLRDILELFRDTGIGKEGYSLIGQGRIDEILSVKSEDRRQVFEEAAGIVKFRVRKDEAERKLERTRDNLSRVQDILEELGGRLEPLRAQSEAAQRYLKLAEELKGLELNIFLVRSDKARERMAALDQAIEGLRDVLLQNEAQRAECARQRDTLEQSLAALEETLGEARARHLSCNDSLHEAQAACDVMAQRLTADEAQEKRLEGEREGQQKRRDGLHALLQSSEAGMAANSDALAQAQAALDGEQAALDAAAARADACEETLNAHKAAILEAVNRLNNVRTVQTRQQTIRAQMETRLSELTRGESELESQHAQLQDALRAAEETERAVSASLTALRDDALALETNVRAQGAELTERAERAQALNMQIQAGQSRLRLMEEMAREYEGYHQSVKKALSFARGDERVHGVVARLMRVPRALETAVDMVLGGALQHIVTQDEDTAKRVIDYLRANKLGRATFLPMTAVRGRVLSSEERRLLSMPGCLGVASGLIEYDAQYRGIMENLLGRTVVAEDLSSGIQIMRAGRHAFRLVTLAGDVMHSGGSMTGGTAQGRAVSLLGREREMTELRERLDAQRGELSQERRAIEALQAQREEAKKLRDEALGRVHQEEIAVAREQERVFNARAELTAHETRMQQTADAIAQLTGGIREIDEDLRRVSEKTELEALDREAMENRTEQLQTALADAREQAERARERVTRSRLSFAELSHAMDSLKRDKDRVRGEIEAADRALARLQEEIAALAGSRAQTERELASRRAQADALAEAVREGAQRVEQLEERRRATQGEQGGISRRMEELHAAYAEDTARLHRQELSRARVEADLKAMTDHIFNAYELTYAGAEAYRAQGEFQLTAGERRAGELKSEIRAMGSINVGAIEEYTETRERYDALEAQRADLDKAQGDLTDLIDKLLRQMEKQFMSEFVKLNAYFGETFARLFGGGQAELKLTDPDDALACGIEIVAQPPGKKLQLLSLLSGGERALTAIAILFAMLKLKPTPFCILDEIEAALDEANINYFADYLAEYAKSTQFVVVTHRKGTMERCDSLYGVAMEEKGVSSMVSVNLTDYE